MKTIECKEDLSHDFTHCMHIKFVFDSHVLFCSSLGKTKLEDFLCCAKRNGAVPTEGLFDGSKFWSCSTHFGCIHYLTDLF